MLNDLGELLSPDKRLYWVLSSSDLNSPAVKVLFCYCKSTPVLILDKSWLGIAQFPYLFMKKRLSFIHFEEG